MIVISPFTRKPQSGTSNPKDYPWWPELISLLPTPVVQVGVSSEPSLVSDHRKDLSLTDLSKLIAECDLWISCDSFLQHFAWDLGKPGAVLWGPSDPLIYGHPENLNICKGRDVLAPDQFVMWHMIDVDPERFVKPLDVIHQLHARWPWVIPVPEHGVVPLQLQGPPI